jgi:hypothetical protein
VDDSKKSGATILSKDMAKRSYRDLFGIFEKWLGLYLEKNQKPGVFLEICGLRLDLVKRQGPSCKIFKLNRYNELFQ